MENRWNHCKAGTEVQRPGSGPENELNPKRSPSSCLCCRCDDSESVAQSSAGRSKDNRLLQRAVAAEYAHESRDVAGIHSQRELEDRIWAAIVDKGAI